MSISAAVSSQLIRIDDAPNMSGIQVVTDISVYQAAHNLYLLANSDIKAAKRYLDSLDPHNGDRVTLWKRLLHKLVIHNDNNSDDPFSENAKSDVCLTESHGALVGIIKNEIASKNQGILAHIEGMIAEINWVVRGDLSDVVDMYGQATVSQKGRMSCLAKYFRLELYMFLRHRYGEKNLLSSELSLKDVMISSSVASDLSEQEVALTKIMVQYLAESVGGGNLNGDYGVLRILGSVTSANSSLYIVEPRLRHFPDSIRWLFE